MTNGATPLFMAAQEGHMEAVRFLIESGANKDQGMTDGSTPLVVAAQEGRLEVVRFLVESGANKDAMHDKWSNAFVSSSAERAG